MPRHKVRGRVVHSSSYGSRPEPTKPPVLADIAEIHVTQIRAACSTLYEHPAKRRKLDNVIDTLDFAWECTFSSDLAIKLVGQDTLQGTNCFGNPIPIYIENSAFFSNETQSLLVRIIPNKQNLYNWMDEWQTFSKEGIITSTELVITDRQAENAQCPFAFKLRCSMQIAKELLQSGIHLPSAYIQQIVRSIYSVHIFNKTVNSSTFISTMQPPASISPLLVEAVKPDRKGKGRAQTSPHTEMLDDMPLLEPKGLACKLFPFQSKTIRFLLMREGVRPKSDSTTAVEPLRDLEYSYLARGLACWEYVDDDGDVFWIDEQKNHIQRRQNNVERPVDAHLEGTMLCDEMGLGKTVEILSLILMHTSSERNNLPTYKSDIAATVRPSKATLVIVPTSIAGQWETEIEKHAPKLRVLRYNGIKNFKPTSQQVVDSFDIVLTTYDILGAELVYAQAPVVRNLRRTKNGEERLPSYRRSLLVEVEWFRVVIDEAQMTGSVVSNIAKTAALIPRVFSLAVTGTPDISDLRGIFHFLKIALYSNSNAFNQLRDIPGNFERVIRQVLTRYTKKQVKSQLHVPVQHRYIVPLDLSQIEQYSYNARYLDALMHVGFDEWRRLEDEQNWNPTTQDMSTWINTLRQLCFHAAFMDRPARQTNGAKKEKDQLKTLDQVLDSMKQKNLSALLSDQKAYHTARVHQAHLLMFDKEHCERFEDALAIFAETSDALQPILKDLEGQLDQLIEIEAKKMEEDTGTISDAELLTVAARNHLRDFHRLNHSCHFYSGMCYFNMGIESEKEEAAYAHAESIRKKLLSSEETNVQKAIVKMTTYIQDNQLEITELEMPFTTIKPGIQSAGLFEQVETITEELNEAAELIWEWRELIVKGLATPVESNEQWTGEEYEERAKVQEQLDIYLEEYNALVADWDQAITGQRTAQNVQTVRPVIYDENGVLIPEGPRELLEKEIKQKRASCFASGFLRSLRSLAQSFAHLLDDEDLIEEEIPIITEERHRVREATLELESVLDELKKEKMQLGLVYNARVDYFKGLQAISDTVRDIDVYDKKFQGVYKEIQASVTIQNRLKGQITAHQSRKRYLASLTSTREQAIYERLCLICGDKIDEGALTNCGHIFCMADFKRWGTQRGCPVCRARLPDGSWQAVSLDHNEKLVEDKKAVPPPPTVGEPQNLVDLGEAAFRRLNFIPTAQLDQILSLPSEQMISTKLDAVCKHVQYIRRNEPEAKIIVFSAWTQSLEMLLRAFDRVGIQHCRLEGKSQKTKNLVVKQFVENPNIAVFVLHSRSQSAGLNLIAAKYVILLEPLLQAAMEQQAIGRVHRIGQMEETTVFQYVIRSTVEERIAALAARQGSSLFLHRDVEMGSGAETPMELDEDHGNEMASKEDSGFDLDDMASILFESADFATAQKALLRSVTEQPAEVEV